MKLTAADLEAIGDDVRNLHIFDERWLDRILRIRNYRWSAYGDMVDEHWSVIVALDSEVDHLPVSRLKSKWAPDAYERAMQEARDYYDHWLDEIRSLQREWL